jgi:glycosyltransferase involved in cell wall biosynthesis
MISLIVIALNEGKRIGKLLESIKNQSFQDYEVIVSDAGSKDNTIKIAKEYGCKVVKGGLPPVGRNNGAKAAKGDILFFMDADITLSKDFLKESVANFNKKKLDVAGVYMKADSSHFMDKCYYSFLNFWFFIMQKVYPHVVGSCMVSKKEVFDKIGGFDSSIHITEDLDYANRASKYFRFGLTGTNVSVSARRFAKEGRLKMGVKYILIFLHRVFFGEIKKKGKFNYRFGIW